ncbi:MULTISPECIES: M48 family metallopeptidase [Amycolatopsis]|uniref:M48 family metallopeptidase n=1 Tax=Amycolatopsis dongchuanensis TaxID=1070866 RepID=A0ABP9QCC0_9PSEU
MRFSVRAVVCLVLLAAFPVVVLAVAAGLGALEVFALRANAFTGVKIGLIVLPVLFVLVKAVFTLDRLGDGERGGVVVTPEAQPRLWGLVRRLAADVGTAPPDEIRLVPAVNAGVSEDARLAGLRVTKRRMIIGAPLLAGLSEAQLTAVLAHELAHYSNRDTRFAAATYRGFVRMARTLGQLSRPGWFDQVVAAFFAAYARFYLRLSSTLSRRQELAADALAATIAGPHAAASALREVEALAFAWHRFLSRYAGLGWSAGYLPRHIFGGFTAVLTDPGNRAELDAVRAQPGTDATPYDSHPPTAERVALLETLPGPAVTADRPARDLLENPDATFEAVMAGALREGADAKFRLDWPLLVHVSIRHDAGRAVEPLFRSAGYTMQQQPATLATVLDAFETGRLAGHRELRQEMELLVTVALADAGLARWELSWSAPAQLTYEAGYGERLTAVLDAGDAAGLRKLVADAGLPLDWRPSASVSYPHPEAVRS